MNLDELRSVQSKERRKDSLQHLRDAFYDDVAAYLTDLRAARDRRADRVEKPFSDDDVRRMSDELETAEEVAEALYERRVGKVVKLASFAAADMPVETEGMTTQERALFDDLVERIESNKAAVLDVLTGEVAPSDAGSSDVAPGDTDSADTVSGDTSSIETPPIDDPPTGDPADTDPTTGREGDDTGVESSDSAAESGVLAGAMGGEPDRGSAGKADATVTPTADPPTADPPTADPPTDDPAEPGAVTDRTPVEPEPAPPGAPGVTEPTPKSGSASDPVTDGSGSVAESATAPAADRETVRITRDVGAILGVDEREYDLASEDVVTLPTANAEPLVRRDAAERID